jgi:hypothetical protein
LVRIPLLAGSLALYLALRFLVRRGGRDRVRLPDGRRLRLLSSVALLKGSACDLLALEYVSTLSSSDAVALRAEARGLLRAVADRPEYAVCTSAMVTARAPGARQVGPAPRDRVFAFRRAGAGAEWSPAEGLD